MDTTTLDFNTLILLVAITGSTLTIVAMTVRQSNRHEDGLKSVNTSVAALETRVTALETKVDALDGKVDGLDGKVDAMGDDVSDARERLARVEGYLMGPESLTPQPPHPPIKDPPRDDPATRPPTTGEPSVDDPAGGHREAG